MAAPIVPVVKNDTNISICGDSEMTINQASQLDSYPLLCVDDLYAAMLFIPVFADCFDKSLVMQYIRATIVYMYEHNCNCTMPS